MRDDLTAGPSTSAAPDCGAVSRATEPPPSGGQCDVGEPQQSDGSHEAAFEAFFATQCLKSFDFAAVVALLSQVVTGVAFLLAHGPAGCLPKALAYLALGLLNLAALTLPPPAARANRRAAAAAALRLMYMLPALGLMDSCFLGPGSAAAAGGGGSGVRGGGGPACGAAPKGLVKLLVYDSGAVFALWYGLMLPLPLRLHAPVQAAQWLAAAARLGRRACAARLGGCEAAAFVRLRALAAAAVGAATGVGGLAAAASGSGDPGTACDAEEARVACNVVVQLFVFAAGLAAPLACGYAFERVMRARFASERADAGSGAGAGGSGSESSGGGGSRARGASPWKQLRGVPPPAGRAPAAAWFFACMAVAVIAWLVAEALAPAI